MHEGLLSIFRHGLVSAAGAQRLLQGPHTQTQAHTETVHPATSTRPLLPLQLKEPQTPPWLAAGFAAYHVPDAAAQCAGSADTLVSRTAHGDPVAHLSASDWHCQHAHSIESGSLRGIQALAGDAGAPQGLYGCWTDAETAGRQAPLRLAPTRLAVCAHSLPTTTTTELCMLICPRPAYMLVPYREHAEVWNLGPGHVPGMLHTCERCMRVTRASHLRPACIIEIVQLLSLHTSIVTKLRRLTRSGVSRCFQPCICMQESCAQHAS